MGEPSEEKRREFEERWRGVTEEGRMRGLDYEHLEEFGPELERIEEKIMSVGGPYICELSDGPFSLLFEISYIKEHIIQMSESNINTQQL